MDSIKKFYCDDSILESETVKVDYLLNYCFSNAEYVEFNILYTDDLLDKLLIDLRNDIVFFGEKFDKIYVGGKSIRFKLSDKVKTFVKSRKFHGWKNFSLEDISFIKSDREFLATISHENQIIFQMSEAERSILNGMGFNFIYDYGDDPRESTRFKTSE